MRTQHRKPVLRLILANMSYSNLRMQVMVKRSFAGPITQILAEYWLQESGSRARWSISVCTQYDDDILWTGPFRSAYRPDA